MEDLLLTKEKLSLKMEYLQHLAKDRFSNLKDTSVNIMEAILNKTDERCSLLEKIYRKSNEKTARINDLRDILIKID